MLVVKKNTRKYTAKPKIGIAKSFTFKAFPTARILAVATFEVKKSVPDDILLSKLMYYNLVHTKGPAEEEVSIKEKAIPKPQYTKNRFKEAKEKKKKPAKNFGSDKEFCEKTKG